jgi:peroxiredoxin
VELRQALEEMPDVVILYVMADGQINPKTQRFIDGNELRDRVIFLRDPQSRVIDRLGLRKEEPEPIEEGVPHPATYVLDRAGVIRLVDVRLDYHMWIDPEPVVAALRAAGDPT